jgi:ABC-type polar amino acid transport system ATPase subunit
LRAATPVITLDELHKYAKWKSWLKGLFDSYGDRARFIVTGSSRLDVFKRGGDSLMGRYFLYRMHPWSVAECVSTAPPEAPVRPPAPVSGEDWEALRVHGGFPEPFLKRDPRFTRRWRALRHEQLAREDLRDVTQESVRAAIGLVPQDVVLFNDTLAYNIAYGRPDATPEEIDEAAKMARLEGLIAAAPMGLQTKVGERGLKLSGGERQRVGIARALLKNPAILVLDEATSSLDSVTEAEVREALEDAAKGRTTLVVAHRLSTVADADEIIVLADGKVAERGSHEALLAKGEVYAELWEMQARMNAQEVAEIP